jgi:all-trans-retinol 13,14-reductase
MIKADVVIIGSGISSLTCGALLSQKGKSVIILEQYTKPGGYLHCFSRFGERFDTGAHYVGALEKGQPFHTLLNYLKVYDEDLFVPLDPSGFDVFHFPDFKVEFPKGYENLISQLGNQFPNDRVAIRTYFEKVRKVVTHFPTYEFDDSMDSQSLLEASETSLAAVVSQITNNPQLQCLFYSYCTLHGVSPEEVSFGFHAIVTDSLIRGPYGLKKGGDALTKKFIQQIEANGGRVLTKQRVVKLVAQKKQVTEVHTQDGSVYVGDWIISGIHPKTTIELLSDQESLTPAFKDRVRNLKESVGIFGVSAFCELESPFHPLRNYYFFSSVNPQSFLKSQNRSVPPVVFISCANREIEGKLKSRTLNLHAPGPIEWFSQWGDSRYGKRPEEYKLLKQSYAEGMFNLVDRYYPRFQTMISKYVASTPLTNLHFNGSAEGSAFGIYHSIQNTGARALGPRTKIHNLLLTGQNCLFPGLLGAAVSALRTSGHIVGIKPILNELKQLRMHYEG